MAPRRMTLLGFALTILGVGLYASARFVGIRRHEHLFACLAIALVFGGLLVLAQSLDVRLKRDALAGNLPRRYTVYVGIGLFATSAVLLIEQASSLLPGPQGLWTAASIMFAGAGGSFFGARRRARRIIHRRPVDAQE